jgi:MmyB-like transcription regulator ligand binding domain
VKQRRAVERDQQPRLADVLAGERGQERAEVARHRRRLRHRRREPSLRPPGQGAAPELLDPPVNVLRLALHPDGVAPRIENLAQFRGTLLLWLRREAVATGDPALEALYEELAELPGGRPSLTEQASEDVAVPLRIRSGESVLSFVSTLTTFRARNRRDRRRALDRVLLPDRRVDSRGAARVRGLPHVPPGLRLAQTPHPPSRPIISSW